MTEQSKDTGGAPLHRLVDGRQVDAGELSALVYEDLRRMASSFFTSGGRDGTLQPTALVHEAYVRLADSRTSWESRAHFMSLAARIMRGVLVDAARARNSEKRGGGLQRITLLDQASDDSDAGVDILDLEEAMIELGSIKERYAEVVELRFFGGLTVEEVAQVLKVSERQVFKDWKMARSYLEVFLAEAKNDDD